MAVYACLLLLVLIGEAISENLNDGFASFSIPNSAIINGSFCIRFQYLNVIQC